MKDIKVRINTAKAYDVTIGVGLLSRCGVELSKITPYCKAAVITDTRVAPLYLQKVEKSLREAGFSVCSYMFPEGEKFKNLGTLSDILEFLAQNRLTRSDLIIALGGGVTGDMAGFAAGVYLRGIRYVQIPTTLLAAVDSSVGGKTAVDLKVGKNLAGVFLQPEAVFCDTACFETLPKDVFSSGLAEAIKYGVICDRELFSVFQEGNVMDRIQEIISRCVSIKGEIVEKDEHENNERRLLNFGHTFGHAIEKCSDYSVPHGHAVAIGMAMAARAGERLGLTEKGTCDKLLEVLKKQSLSVSTGYSAKELSEAAQSDKKRLGETICFVLPRKIGECFMHTVSTDEIERIINLGLE